MPFTLNMSNRSQRRTIVLALDPERDRETRQTVEWAANNFLDASRDKVEIICAVTVDADDDATDLATDTL